MGTIKGKVSHISVQSSKAATDEPGGRSISKRVSRTLTVLYAYSTRWRIRLGEILHCSSISLDR